MAQQYDYLFPIITGRTLPLKVPAQLPVGACMPGQRSWK